MQRSRHESDESEHESAEAPAPSSRVGGAGTLYVVATPIGNLDDLSARARDILGRADLIAAEDTRHTRHLLAHYGINTSLTALHEHNEAGASKKLLALLQAGQSIAVVSDAGTPCIADPGARLVNAAHAAGIRVLPVPGANAAVTALSASGIEGPFLFYGFLPAKAGERRQVLESLAGEPYTLVFYETPHRIVEAVADLVAVLGTGPAGTLRRLVIARELTKKFEAIHEGALAEGSAWLAGDAHRQRGEFVLIVTGAAIERDLELAAAEKTLVALLAELPLKQAVKLAQTITGAPRNLLYERALALAAEKQAGE